MKSQDWDDVADLFDQCVALVEMAPRETNTVAARRYAINRLLQLVRLATRMSVATKREVGS